MTTMIRVSVCSFVRSESPTIARCRSVLMRLGWPPAGVAGDKGDQKEYLEDVPVTNRLIPARHPSVRFFKDLLIGCICVTFIINIPGSVV